MPDVTEPRLTLPVLPLKNVVVFPRIIQHLAVGRQRSMAALAAAAEGKRELIAVAQLDANVEDPALSDLHAVGTVVEIKRIERAPGYLRQYKSQRRRAMSQWSNDQSPRQHCFRRFAWQLFWQFQHHHYPHKGRLQH